MIRHCVAHPFGAAVGRSSQQAALLEPGEGSHPPSMRIREHGSPDAKKPTLRSVFQFGGEGGIRTLDTLPYTHFPGVLLQPLGHLTKFLLLEVAFGARCACILPTSSVGSLSDTSPKFGLLLHVFSQHGFVALLRRNGA